jgi:hypothetical protein
VENEKKNEITLADIEELRAALGAEANEGDDGADLSAGTSMCPSYPWEGA